jgi:TonB family protein
MMSCLRLISAVTLFVIGMIFLASSPVVAADDVQQQRSAFMPYDKWQQYLIKTAPPIYPYADRARWHQGSGLFRLAIDKKTGAVIRIAVEKSTGFKTLDDSAIAALRQWRFRSSTFKAALVPVNFVMSKTKTDYIKDVQRLQKEQRRL